MVSISIGAGLQQVNIDFPGWQAWDRMLRHHFHTRLLEVYGRRRANRNVRYDFSERSLLPAPAREPESLRWMLPRAASG